MNKFIIVKSLKLMNDCHVYSVVPLQEYIDNFSGFDYRNYEYKFEREEAVRVWVEKTFPKIGDFIRYSGLSNIVCFLIQNLYSKSII